jgi:Ca-activated chloride channel homolog
MPPNTLNRLTLWGSLALALGLIAACAAHRSPDTSSDSQMGYTEEVVAQGPGGSSPEPVVMAEEASVGRGAPRAPRPPVARSESAAQRSVPPGMIKAGAQAHQPISPGVAGAIAPTRSRPNPYAPPEPVTQGDTFVRHAPHAFTETAEDRLSTFAVDVDTASYTVTRRYLEQGNLPPPSAVRVEEFVNYFKYRYTPPEKEAFTVNLEGAPSPFGQGRHFVRVGVQGKVVSRSQRKPAHLVFLVDTSGSMNSPDRLPLAKEAMKIAVKNLNENDTVAIVTYAGGTRDVLPSTPATDVERIHAAIDSLRSGGGTAMGSGMEMAYRHAVKKAAGNVVSRVIVLTDGDTNIGPNLSADAMLASIQKYVAEGVTLSTIGFGMGNYRDDLMERLANKGNGNCFYIDSYKEARKVFETQLTGTLEVIAKDVKVQVEFDPAVVRRYRLVGYENRDVADRDFRNDKVDAGEIGAGHSVTALYEVELTGEPGALGTVRIRAKAPNGTEASEQAFPFQRRLMRGSLEAASTDFRFALAVAATADVLRHSPSAQGWSLATAQKLAEGATEGDADRKEFVKLLARARGLMGSVASDGR